MNDLRAVPLLRRHRQDDGFLPADRLLVDIGGGHLFLRPGDAGQQVHQRAEPAHFPELAKLAEHILQVQAALLDLAGELLGLFLLDRLGRLLDQADDIAHAQDTAGDPVRVEGFEAVQLLAGAHQLDRLAGDGAHRERRAAAGVAVDPGQHDAGDADLFVERLGDGHRVLAGHRVGDQQGLHRVRRLADRGDLVHQFPVDMQPAGGVENDDVPRFQLAGLQRAPGDRRRRLAHHHGKGRDPGLLAEHPELLLRGRPARIQRGHQNALALFLGQVLADLGGCGGLA